jgi:hypothetical protein
MYSVDLPSAWRRMSVTSDSVRRPAPATPEMDEGSERERYIERDFGIGYGNSSGYARPRRYAAGLSPRPFSVR